MRRNQGIWQHKVAESTATFFYVCAPGMDNGGGHES